MKLEIHHYFIFSVIFWVGSLLERQMTRTNWNDKENKPTIKELLKSYFLFAVATFWICVLLGVFNWWK
jgi:hypothetical protein